MKFLKSISLFFCMIGCLGGGIWLGAWGQRTFYPGSSEIRIEGTVHQSQQTEFGKTAGKAEPLVTVAAMPERITADTVYLVKEFDLKQNTCKDSICSIPVSYIGMNREQFLKEMNSFMASRLLQNWKRDLLLWRYRNFLQPELRLPNTTGSMRKIVSGYR